MQIRVLIAEDDPRFRRVMKAVLGSEDEIDVVAEASDGEEAITLTAEYAPHVVVMDVRMPKLSGIAATRVLNEMHPNTKVLMLTISDDEQDLFEAVRAGASGYLLKDGDPDQVAEAIRKTQNGEAVLSPAMASLLMSELALSVRESDGRLPVPLVTHREVQILQQLAEGLPSAEVGKRLGISENTVNNHVQNVLKKLQLHDRVQTLVAELTGKV